MPNPPRVTEGHIVATATVGGGKPRWHQG